MKTAAILGIVLALLASLSAPAAAQKIRIGVLQTTGAGPMYIARDKGHFAREGLDAEIVSFDNAQSLAVSIAAGDLDFGATSLAIGFYNLAAQGVVRIIAAQGRDHPGFPNNGFIVSNAAWEKGFRSYQDLPGRSVGVSTPGSGPHYCVGLLADRFGIPLDAIDVQFLRTSPNIMALLTSNRLDAAVTPSTFALSMVKNGQAHLIGWIGDVTPWQLGAAYTSSKHADRDGELVDKFLRGYRAGMRDYHDAFITPDGKRKDGPAAEEMLGIISKAVDQPVELLRQGITYVDREARLDGEDIKRQIAWHKARGLMNGDVDIDALLDKRYLVLLPR